MTFLHLLECLDADAEFAAWFSRVLADCGFDAFFWELPPLTKTRIDNEAEFVVIASAALERLEPDPAPFRVYFDENPGSDVLTFANLGGDATLIVPVPVRENSGYPHLAAFLRAADADQVRALWQATARVVREDLGTAPRWLSTSGLGVAWLHLRLDTRPKYYQYAPYRNPRYGWSPVRSCRPRS